MVQKYQSPVRVYKHPFELVMAVSMNHSLNTQLLILLWQSIHMNVEGVCVLFYKGYYTGA